MQKDPAWKHRFPCLHKASLVGNINKLDFKCSQTLLCPAYCTTCVRALTPESTGVFYIRGGGSGNRGTGWHHSKPGMCHLPVCRCINYRYFHTYKYVGEHVPHTRARTQSVQSEAHSQPHTHKGTCAENDAPSTYFIIRKISNN